MCAENWNDGISVRDLERVAIAHDFTWTDKELADMIRCFDSDDDGKVWFLCTISSHIYMFFFFFF